MDVDAPLANVACRIEWDGEATCVTIVVRDGVTQRDYRFELPRHALPSLVRLLRDTVKAHPEDFPTLVAYRFD